MSAYPSLLYFTLEERKKRHALVSRLCGLAGCGSPLGYVDAHGLTISARHSKDRVDRGTLTPEDLRRLADFIENLRGNGGTMEAGNQVVGEAA